MPTAAEPATAAAASANLAGGRAVATIVLSHVALYRSSVAAGGPTARSCTVSRDDHPLSPAARLSARATGGCISIATTCAPRARE